MNHIFKVVKNHKGNQVVVSELARGAKKGKTIALMLFSTLIAGTAFATPVSIQGTATSENAVSVGTDSFATAVNGVASGKGSIATGNGFSREDFAVKVKEVEDLTEAKNSAQSDLNKLNNDKKTNELTQNSLNNQIADATQKIADAANKIAQKDALTKQKTAAENNQSVLDQNITNAQNALDAISKEGKNVYINFIDVLSSLNWSSLDGTTQSRDNLANDLKIVIETDFADLKDRYTVDTYRGLIDGYINKQASYTGAVIALNTLENTISNQNSNSFFKKLYSATNLNQDVTLTNESYGNAIKTVSAANDWYLHSYYWGVNSINNPSSYYTAKGEIYDYDELNLVNMQSIQIGSGDVRFNSLITRAEDSIARIKDENIKNESQKILNTMLLYQNSKTQNKDTYLWAFNINYNDGSFINGNSYQSDFGNNSFIYSFKTTSGNKVAPIIGDFVSAYVDTLKNFDSSNQSINTISVSNIQSFNELYEDVLSYYNSIDWNDANAVYDLDSYKAQMDKTLGDAAKLKQINDIYTNIINEKQKVNADQSYIDQQTALLISLKNDIYNTYETNALKDYTFVIKSDRANAELNYSLTDTARIINQANRDLKLYDKDDALVVDVTNKAKELQNALNEAKKAAEDNRANINDLENKINDIGLTPAEEAAAETKAELEKQLEDAKNKQTEIDNNIADKTKELEDLTKQLENSSLKDLGLRSQAYGSQAFASGNDSIAIGTNSTVTANDGIALGQNATVTGIESIAIGKDSKVLGTKSIAIGVGHTVSGNRSTTIGDPNTVSGNDAFVAGNNNNVQSNNVMVLGNNVTVAAGFDNAVILGESSAPSQANPTSNIQIRGETFNFSGTSPSSTVSIGSAGKERQITHVAAGRLSDSSTDAINGSQLYAVVAALNKIETDLVTPTDVSDTVGQALKDKLKAGDNITIDETESPDDGTKTYTINAKQPDIQAGDNVSVNKQGDTVTISANLPNIEGGDGVTVNKVGDTITINAEGKTYTAGDNVSITADHKINANGTTVSGNADVVIKTTTEAGANGATNTNYEVTISDGLKEKINKEESVTAGSNNLSVTQNDTNDTGGKNFVVDLSKDLDLTAGGSLKIGDINLAAGNVNMGDNVISGVAEGKAPTDAVNVSQLQKAKTGIKAGDKVKVSPEEQQDGSTVYTVNALTTEVKAGTNAKITKEAGDQGQDVYNVEVKGDLTDINSLTNGDTTLTLGNNNVNVGGATIGGVAKATKDDEAVNLAQLKAAKTGIEAGKKVTVTPVDQPDGTTKFTVNAHTSEVTNGKNTTVTKDVGTEGQDIFKVNVEGDLTNITSIANGDTKLSIGDGVINAGGSTLSNIAEGKAPTDAVNVSQLNVAKSSVKAGDKVKVTHEKQDDGSTVYTVNALTSHVTGGKNVVVDKTTGENGEDKFTVNLASDLTDINSIKKGNTGFTFGDNNIDVGGATLSNIGTPVNDNDAATKSYVDNSRTSVTSTDATVRVVKTVVNAMTGAVNYDLSVTAKAPEFTFGVGTKDEIKFKDGGHLNIVGGSDAIETKVDGNTIKVDLSEAGKATLAKVNNGINSQTDDGKTLNYQLGDTIKVTGDGKNLTTTTTAEGKVSVRLKDDVKVNSVTTGNVSISTQGINAGGNKVVNVANGHISPTSKDAVNGSQLYATNIQVNQNTQNIANLGERVNHLDDKVNRLRKENRAGIAGAAAIAGLPEIHLAGKSMVSAAAGTYRGENAIAIGYSRLSDNSKVKIKLSGSASTRGDFIGTVGIGYAW